MRIECRNCEILVGGFGPVYSSKYLYKSHDSINLWPCFREMLCDGLHQIMVESDDNTFHRYHRTT